MDFFTRFVAAFLVTVSGFFGAHSTKLSPAITPRDSNKTAAAQSTANYVSDSGRGIGVSVGSQTYFPCQQGMYGEMVIPLGQQRSAGDCLEITLTKIDLSANQADISLRDTTRTEALVLALNQSQTIRGNSYTLTQLTDKKAIIFFKDSSSDATPQDLEPKSSISVTPSDMHPMNNTAVLALISKAGKPYISLPQASAHADYTSSDTTLDNKAASDASIPQEAYAKVADKSNFKDLKFVSYASDGVHVYFWSFGTGPGWQQPFWEPIANADPNSFRVIGGPFGADKHNVYFETVFKASIVSKDPSSFSLVNLPFGLTKDRGHAYFADQPIPEADPSSFVAIQMQDTNYGGGKDKNWIYLVPRGAFDTPDLYRLPISDLGTVTNSQETRVTLPDGCYPSDCWGHFGCNYEICTRQDGSTYEKMVN